MVVNDMQLELDYIKIGRRIKAARLEKGLNQSDLGAMVGCSNNHMSHVEVGQTKVSLSMLVKLSVILEKDFDYFLLDTPYVRQERIINSEISEKLKQCSSMTLVTVSKILDALLEQQEMQRAERDRCDD
ncbi:DNA-binding protein [Butyricicoccus pullicaecorum]|uniref:DNA-binding protein n=2 Tax=Butyricicoccus pullicaecorum TaxID=501571 RepID=A0A1Y4LW92_9FIRM|nr:DNA-binding protein [Butyricicoccus pullicaecorum]